MYISYLLQPSNLNLKTKALPDVENTVLESDRERKELEKKIKVLEEKLDNYIERAAKNRVRPYACRDIQIWKRYVLYMYTCMCRHSAGVLISRNILRIHKNEGLD